MMKRYPIFLVLVYSLLALGGEAFGADYVYVSTRLFYWKVFVDTLYKVGCFSLLLIVIFLPLFWAYKGAIKRFIEAHRSCIGSVLVVVSCCLSYGIAKNVVGLGTTVYVKDIEGTVYYEAGAANCAAVTAADTAGDLEDACGAAGAAGTVNICAGAYAGADLDANGYLTVDEAAITIQSAEAGVTLTGQNETVYPTNAVIFVNNVDAIIQSTHGMILEGYTGNASSVGIAFEVDAADVTELEFRGLTINTELYGIRCGDSAGTTPGVENDFSLSGLVINGNSFNVARTSGDGTASRSIYIWVGDEGAGQTGTLSSAVISTNTFTDGTGTDIDIGAATNARDDLAKWSLYGIDCNGNTHTRTLVVGTRLWFLTGEAVSYVRNGTFTDVGYGSTAASNTIKCGGGKNVKIYGNTITGTRSNTSDGLGVILDHAGKSGGALTGDWDFTATSDTITEQGGDAGAATTQLYAQTWLLTAGGNLYQVKSITDNNTVVLTSAATATENDVAVYLFDAVEDAEIYGNFISGCERGIGASWSIDAKIYNNVIDNTLEGPGISIVSSTLGGRARNYLIYNNTIYRTYQHGILLDNKTVGGEIYNNSIAYVGLAPTGKWDAIYLDTAGGAEQPTEGYNGFYQIDPLSVGENCNNCTNQAGNYPVTSDPKFNDPAGLDFTLQDDSPYIGTGADLTASGVTYDIIGTARPQAGRFDIGAYEKIITTAMRLYPGQDSTITNALVASGKYYILNATGISTRFATIGGVTVITENSTAIDTIFGDIILAPGVVLTATYCAFPQTEAEIEALGGTVADKTGCLFGIDPLFFNLAGNDYRLKQLSPAVGTGIAVAGVTTDIRGRARIAGRSPDMGAYQGRFVRLPPVVALPLWRHWNP